MSGSLKLHATKMVNPRITCCINCGKDVGVALLGATDYLLQCRCGKSTSIGRPERAQSCGCKPSEYSFERGITEYEKLAIELCTECEANQKETAEWVVAGGIFFKCSDCHAGGAIKAEHPLAKAVRKQLGIEAPKPCGVEFSKIDCPSCSEEAKKNER